MALFARICVFRGFLTAGFRPWSPHYFKSDLDKGPKSTTLYQKNLVNSMRSEPVFIMIFNTPPACRSTAEIPFLRGGGALH